MELDVRKTLQDSAYIAVGVGVIGWQHAGDRAKATQAKLRILADDVLDRVAFEMPRPDARALAGQARHAGTKAQVQARQTRDRAREQARRAGTMAQSQAREATTKLRSSAMELAGRAEPLVGDVRSRVEPLAGPLQGLPQQVTRAVDAGRQRVRRLAATAS
ncbi:MAG: hypothetical protein U0V73_14195 [Acidimicrobiia bacterium]